MQGALTRHREESKSLKTGKHVKSYSEFVKKKKRKKKTKMHNLKLVYFVESGQTFMLSFELEARSAFNTETETFTKVSVRDLKPNYISKKAVCCKKNMHCFRCGGPSTWRTMQRHVPSSYQGGQSACSSPEPPDLGDPKNMLWARGAENQPHRT